MRKNIKKNDRVKFLSSEFEVIEVDHIKQKVLIRNSARKLKQPDRWESIDKVHTHEQQQENIKRYR